MKKTLIFTLLVLTCKLYAQINRGPYIQQGGPNSIILKWRTDKAENSQVNIGLSTNNISLEFKDNTITKNHEVKISGLQANTKYYYQVGSQSSLYQARVNQENQFFNTAPNFGEEKAFRTWILGDPGTQDFRQRKVRDGFLNFSNGNSPDLMLLLGDNAYSYGTQEEYQAALFENMYENILINTHLWSSTGNHDLLYGYEDVFYGIFTFPTQGELGGVPSNSEGYYSFNYANAHFVTIETSEEDLDDTNGEMIKWLENDLKNNTQDWIIVYFHHPVYSGGHDSDKEKDLINLRKNFVPIIEKYGADVVLYGHSHRYERTGLIKGHFDLSNTWNPSTMAIDNGLGQENNGGVYDKTTSRDGTVYITTGNAGKGLGDDGAKPVHKVTSGAIGSGILDIDGKRLDYKQLDGDGNIIDHFTIIKDEFITIPIPDETTIEIGINNDNDDVEENENGIINYNSSDLELVYDHSTIQVVGLRFNNIELPKNATIKNAYIQFTADENNSDTTELEISLHNLSNSPAFSTSNNVSQRLTFSEKIKWTPSQWTRNQKTDNQKTPELKSLIQSLVNKENWYSGNSLSFIIKGTGVSTTNPNSKRVAYSYDNSTSKAPKLVITYKLEQDSDPDPIEYCSSKSSRTDYEYIQRIQLNTIDNSSEGSASGYEDYTEISTELNNENTISITPKWPKGNSYNEGFSVWIDYNKDGDFLDEGELVFSEAPNKEVLISKNFFLPKTYTSGNTRMRVSMKYNKIPTSCELFTYGEVEDYTVILPTNLSKSKTSNKTLNNVKTYLNISPNPVKNNSFIKIKTNITVNLKYQLVNLNGKVIQSGKINRNYTIPIKRLKTGVYLLNIEDSESNKFINKVVIE
ncbi:GEVED domain-containing protein [Tenacibaculum sp. 190524A02b]|uniref:GEVED domain-containing protein n=1 Tax=Tenacibaculum vairaonense TaxID=3137860 RepID=UPI0031FB4D63